MTVAFAVMMVVGAVISVVSARRLWRNDVGYDNRPPLDWVRSLATWRAWWRSFAFVFPATMSLGAFAVVLGTIAPGRAWADAIGLALLGLAGLNAIVLGFTVHYFNWPKWAVPPHLRHQPGWISEKLGHPVEITEPPKRPPPDWW